DDSFSRIYAPIHDHIGRLCRKDCMYRIISVLWVLLMCVAVNRAQAQDAATLYDKYCAKCHGPAGQPPKTPDPGHRTAYDFSNCVVSSAESTAPWKLAVAHGGPAIGLSDDMRGFSDKLTDTDITSLVRYIRGICVDQGWPNGNLNFSRPI